MPGVFPTTEVDFYDLRDAVAARVDLATRLPAWPFHGARGYATIFEYDEVLHGHFGRVLHALASAYGDETVTAVGVEPRWTYYRDSYGLLPAVRIEREHLGDGYGDALRFEPNDDPTGSLEISLNVLAIAGSSGAWSVFADRAWEIGLLLTPDRDGGWLDAGVAWFPTDVDLDSILPPAGWGTPLSQQDREELSRHLRERGSGV